MCKASGPLTVPLLSLTLHCYATRGVDVVQRSGGPARRSGHQPVLHDVAELAGVSQMTVSRVLNDTGPVKPDTRKRVLESVQQLGYRPNALARGLATGRSRTLGVVALDSVLHGPASTLLGVENAAREAGYGVSISSVSDPEDSGRAIDVLRGQCVAGIVVIAPHVRTAQALADVPGDVPVVAVADTDQAPVPVVAVDQRSGARLATEHLLALGHRPVWHVAGPEGWLETEAREQSWRDAMRVRGVPEPPVLRGDWSPRSGYQAGRELVAHGGVDAVFVANDQMALGVLRAMAEAGLSVPHDVRVVGFDDVPEAAYFCPPLTTVRQDFLALGRKTFEQMLLRMEGGRPVRRSIVPAELIVRDSTGPGRC